MDGGYQPAGKLAAPVKQVKVILTSQERAIWEYPRQKARQKRGQGRRVATICCRNEARHKRATLVRLAIPVAKGEVGAVVHGAGQHVLHDAGELGGGQQLLHTLP